MIARFPARFALTVPFAVLIPGMSQVSILGSVLVTPKTMSLSGVNCCGTKPAHTIDELRDGFHVMEINT